MAQNFAPGTTAADIESAVTPLGGVATACRLVKTHPIVIAEIVFESKESADQVILTFNNQTVSPLLNVIPPSNSLQQSNYPHRLMEERCTYT